MAEETYNPWTIVNVVFHHLAEQGLHPEFGPGGHPGEPAAALLRTMGIQPVAEGDNRVQQDVKQQLADLRAAVFDEP